MKKMFLLYGCLLLILFLFSFSTIFAVGTDINIDVIENTPKYNVSLKIVNKRNHVIENAVVYLKVNDKYLPTDESDEDGNVHLSLFDNEISNLMIVHEGYESKYLTYSRPKGRSNIQSIELSRVGEFRDIELNNIRLEGLMENCIYPAAENILFSVVHSGIKNKLPMLGDNRYEPLNWYIENIETEETFNKHGFENHLDHVININKAGHYRLHIEFQEQIYEKSGWENHGDIQNLNRTFKIADFSNEKDNSDESYKQDKMDNNSIKNNNINTGDELNLRNDLFIACMCLIIFFVLSKFNSIND